MVDKIETVQHPTPGQTYTEKDAEKLARTCCNTNCVRSIVNYTEENIGARKPFETEKPVLSLLYLAVEEGKNEKKTKKGLRVRRSGKGSNGMGLIKIALLTLVFLCFLFLLLRTLVEHPYSPTTSPKVTGSDL